MEAVRTCLGCRQRAPRSSLLRVVAHVVDGTGEVIADPSATLPGRGAWVHPTTQCVDTAITRKAFGRALRVEGALDASSLHTTITETAD